jgi:formylglycine-generating enzyme required for sulfatase activity
MGFLLRQAQAWLRKRPLDISEADTGFIARSWNASRIRRVGVYTLVAALIGAIVLGALLFSGHDSTVLAYRESFYKGAGGVSTMTTTQESGLKAGDSFQECHSCPEMVVVPAGRFLMGSPSGEGRDEEHPQHEVTIGKPFAVAKSPLTFDQWDMCRNFGPCGQLITVDKWRGQGRPAIHVSWEDAQTYVAWLSRMTGKEYRLLSEAEYEYAARAQTETKYPWGDEINLDNKAMANCIGCGAEASDVRTSPVGSFAPNRFKLQDMVGNVQEWTEDCGHDTYDGAPIDGSAWTTSGCGSRVIRGGGWAADSEGVRSAARDDYFWFNRSPYLGFRVARTLSAGAAAVTAAPGAR